MLEAVMLEAVSSIAKKVAKNERFISELNVWSVAY